MPTSCAADGLVNIGEDAPLDLHILRDDDGGAPGASR
jgi:hypothetical protein